MRYTENIRQRRVKGIIKRPTLKGNFQCQKNINVEKIISKMLR